ncbi:MAG: hypothetical protein ACPGWR_33820 [Ardenticatenaceae bacterium]
MSRWIVGFVITRSSSPSVLHRGFHYPAVAAHEQAGMRVLPLLDSENVILSEAKNLLPQEQVRDERNCPLIIIAASPFSSRARGK